MRGWRRGFKTDRLAAHNPLSNAIHDVRRADPLCDRIAGHVVELRAAAAAVYVSDIDLAQRVDRKGDTHAAMQSHQALPLRIFRTPEAAEAAAWRIERMGKRR